jgi:FAD/FMN-containing dehydrogenase
MNAPLPLSVTRSGARGAYDTVARASNEVAGRLAARLAAETRGEVLFSPADRGRYATDASIYQIDPVGVVVPRTDDIAYGGRHLPIATAFPSLPRGAGTSAVRSDRGRGLVIDCGQVCARDGRSLDVEQRSAVVQPGLVLDHLNAMLRPHGLWFPVDVSTSAQATIGG